MIKKLITDRIAQLKVLENSYSRSQNNESEFYAQRKIGTNLRQVRDLLALNSKILSTLNGYK